MCRRVCVDNIEWYFSNTDILNRDKEIFEAKNRFAYTLKQTKRTADQVRSFVLFLCEVSQVGRYWFVAAYLFDNNRIVNLLKINANEQQKREKKN